MTTFSELFKHACHLCQRKANKQTEAEFIKLLHDIEDFVVDGHGSREQRSTLLVISYPDVKSQLLAMPLKDRKLDLAR